jgi:hypothetical protein
MQHVNKSQRTRCITILFNVSVQENRSPRNIFGNGGNTFRLSQTIGAVIRVVEKEEEPKHPNSEYRDPPFPIILPAERKVLYIPSQPVSYRPPPEISCSNFTISIHFRGHRKKLFNSSTDLIKFRAKGTIKSGLW